MVTTLRARAMPPTRCGRGDGRGRGFALVDVMVGAILVGISLAVIIGLTGRALASQKRGEELVTAANLADAALHLVLARGPDDYAKRFPVEGPCDPPFADYRYRLEFSTFGVSGSSGSAGSGGSPYRVRVTINWTGSGGAAPQSVVVETLMATRMGGDDSVGGEPDPKRTPEQAVNRNE